MRPVDFVLLFLVGLGAQAPWWSLSTAADFFAVSLPLMRAEFWFGASYAVAISIALPFNLTLSAGRLWLVGVLSSILMLLGMIYFVVLPFVAISVTLSFWIALITCGVANFASAMLLNACYGIFAPLHVRNSLVMQVSGVVCALLMGLLRVILLYSSITVLYSGVLFFAFAMLLIAVAFVCFVILRSRHSKSTHLYSPLVVSMSDSDISEMELVGTWKQAFLGSWKPLVALFLDFTILFFCYPGLLSAIHCSEDRTFTVFAFLIFNGADAVGKFLPLLYLPKPNATLMLAVLMWIIFLVLFAGSLPLKQVNEAFFSSQPYAFVLTGLLGVWHGYLCCSCFVLAPSVASEENKSKAGSLSFMFNTSGIFLGSVLSFILAYLVVPVYCK